jgi:hypothetical protein
MRQPIRAISGVYATGRYESSERPCNGDHPGDRTRGHEAAHEVSLVAAGAGPGVREGMAGQALSNQSGGVQARMDKTSGLSSSTDGFQALTSSVYRFVLFEQMGGRSWRMLLVLHLPPHGQTLPITATGDIAMQRLVVTTPGGGMS